MRRRLLPRPRPRVPKAKRGQATSPRRAGGLPCVRSRPRLSAMLLAAAGPCSSPARCKTGTPDSRVVPEPSAVRGAIDLTPRNLADSGGHAFGHQGQEIATRNPILLFSFVGLLLLRLEAANRSVKIVVGCVLARTGPIIGIVMRVRASTHPTAPQRQRAKEKKYTG